MVQNKKSAEKSDAARGGAVGLGVAAVAVAMASAAGAYWLYGSPDAAKNRKSAKSFMLKARAEALAAVEKAKDLDKQAYTNIVDTIVKKYSTVSGITAAEIAQMSKDLKATWVHMQKVRAQHGKTIKARR